MKHTHAHAAPAVMALASVLVLLQFRWPFTSTLLTCLSLFFFMCFFVIVCVRAVLCLNAIELPDFIYAFFHHFGFIQRFAFCLGIRVITRICILYIHTRTYMHQHVGGGCMCIVGLLVCESVVFYVALSFFFSFIDMLTLLLFTGPPFSRNYISFTGPFFTALAANFSVFPARENENEIFTQQRFCWENIWCTAKFFVSSLARITTLFFQLAQKNGICHTVLALFSWFVGFSISKALGFFDFLG